MIRLFPILAFTLTAAAVAGDLPNPQLTPGAIRPELTTRTICLTKWGQDERLVTEAMKLQVFHSYGFAKGNLDSRCPCEIDHLVSRELGGADTISNLWPQPYRGRWNAHLKDRLENRLHTELCAGRITLSAAQAAIRDWINTYIRYFGTPQ